MGSEVETIEERLRSFLGQLQTESGIFERVVYKNKNQHRRCSYFQYLLKVRRDLRLLQSAKVEEILGSCFNVINDKRPKQKINLLESLKRKKCDSGKHNFMERLLGAARLLSQMVEPMLKAAIEISILLARSFFMGFSVTVLALLSRLRVLVQQIFLDVVSVFNMVSFLSQKKHSVKINQDGIEVFREFYPTIREFVILESVWKVDKFVLHEKLHKGEIKSQDEDLRGDTTLEAPVVCYESIESFLGEDEPGSMADDTAKEDPTHASTTHLSVAPCADQIETEKQTEGCMNDGDELAAAGIPSKNISSQGIFPADIVFTPIDHNVASVSTEKPAPSTANDRDNLPAIGTPGKNLPSAGSNPLKRKLGLKDKVAFVSVKKPTPSTTNVTDIHIKENEKNGDKDDPFFSLLTAGNLKDSIF